MRQHKHYIIKGFSGIACRFVGYPQRWEPDTYEVEHSDECVTRQRRGLECYCSGPYKVESGEGKAVDDTDSGRVVMVMVGDDQRYTVDAKDCVEIGELDYCALCGQVGCTRGGRDRSEVA